MRQAFDPRLFRPVDASSLAFFRIAFGLTLFWECVRYYDSGWIERYYIDPAWHFPYPFLEWVTPWPGPGMYLHFGVLALAALGVTLGHLYRVSAAVLFGAFTYVFLLDETGYLNHFYLVSLIAFCMVFVPAHREFSADALLCADPEPGPRCVPLWTIWLLRLMVGLPYFYGGVAKLNADWLIGAQPMGMWLAEREHLPLLGRLVADPEWAMPVAFAFSYGGLLVDLLAVPLLLWSRTRPFMLLVLVSFHLLNTTLFGIGVFPWLMMCATLIFFPPDWPRRLVSDLRASPRRGAGVVYAGLVLGALATAVHGELSLVPFLGGLASGALVTWTLLQPLRPADSPAATRVAALRGTTSGATWRQRTTLVLLASWALFHLLFPLRHLLIPGDVNWTEEGHRFAWHMKLRDKSASLDFYARDPASGDVWEVDARELLTSRQWSRMARRPFLIRQFAHHLKAQLADQGQGEVAIHAEAWVSLNGRESQRMIDPDVDLASEPRSLWHAEWILPLDTPLPERPDYLRDAS